MKILRRVATHLALVGGPWYGDAEDNWELHGPEAHLTVSVTKSRSVTLTFAALAWQEKQAQMARGPVLVADFEGSSSRERLFLYSYGNQYYLADVEIPPKDIPLIVDSEPIAHKERVFKELERLRASAEGSSSSREPIPESVQLVVWNRDKGKCVKCGSRQLLEYDHIIPVSKGGSSTARNLQLLCQKCNRAKRASIGG